MATESNPISEAARAYVERGYRIIALHTAHNGQCSCDKGGDCGSAGKHPLSNGWQKANQIQDGGIRARFEGSTPSNLGIVTGPDSGVFVVDVDGATGNATMKALADEGHALPPTLTVKTGSGGWHFFFEYPDFEIGNTASTKVGKGVDTRGKGGFVVAAPSVSAKGPYKIVKDLPVAKAPDWLLERLRPKERKKSTETGTLPTQSVTPDATVHVPDAEKRRLEGYVEGAVANEIDRLKRLHWDGDPSQYRGEAWDDTTFQVAANLIQLANAEWAGLSLRHLYDAFSLAAPRDPGFDDARVDAKWESALKKVGDNEAVYPPKPIGTFWLDGADNSPAPIVAEHQPTTDTPLDPFDAAVAAAGEGPPPISPPRVEYMTFNGIPVEEGILQPDLVARAKAKALGPYYRAGAYVETVAMVDGLENAVMGISDIIAEPLIPSNQLPNLDAVDDWVRRSMRSGTPELLWATLRAVLDGVDTDAPTIVFKGGAPILRLLAGLLSPAVGEDGETMLLGPRVTTREGDGPQIVFEFDEDERIDLTPYAAAIVERAKSTAAELRIPDEDTHDELEKLTDYRAAQLHRARLGLGSRTRTNGESNAKT